MRIRLLCVLSLLLSPLSALGCEGCRPAVLHIGFSADHIADVALMFLPLAAAVAAAVVIPWEKLPWMRQEKL